MLWFLAEYVNHISFFKVYIHWSILEQLWANRHKSDFIATLFCEFDDTELIQSRHFKISEPEFFILNVNHVNRTTQSMVIHKILDINLGTIPML